MNNCIINGSNVYILPVVSQRVLNVIIPLPITLINVLKQNFAWYPRTHRQGKP
jgi:hypothetical protein